MNKLVCSECGTSENVQRIRHTELCGDCQKESEVEQKFKKETKRMSLRKVRYDKYTWDN